MRGKLNVAWLLGVCVPLMIGAPLYCYYEAVKQDPKKYKFPNATVTETACNYSQDVVFRMAMELAIALLALIYFLVFRWLRHEAIKREYPERMSFITFLLAQGSIGLYAVAVGTIDGLTTGSLHGPCAVIFFVAQLYLVLDMTIYLTYLANWDSRVISLCSLRIKQVLAGYVAAVWIYALGGLIIDSANSNQYVVIVEWNMVIFFLLWMLSFCLEWKKLNLVLTH